jgi:ABC-type phosphate/phosphonate transport system substrate-binding protein
VPQQEASNAGSSVQTATADPGETASTQSAAPNNNDDRVAVVMTRPEIASLSDLDGKDVAIEDQQSASSTSIKAAIASAGAAEVKLSEGSGRAIDRLINGEVTAAVLAIASPEAAEQFSEIPGYRIFRIPLSPG